MDTTIFPNINNININIINKNNSLLSATSSQSKLISEFRDVSTALSAFLHDFDDLRNHITSINSAIDAQLPPHLLLLLLNDPTAAEAIFTELNSNGTEKSNSDLRHANNVDKLEGIDVLNKKKSDSFVNEEEIDISKPIEDIGCDDDDVSKKKKRKKAEISDKIDVLVNKEAEKSDSFRKAGQIDLYRETCINTHNETCILKRKHEEIDKAKKKHGEIDKSKKKKKYEEIDKAKKKDEEIDKLKKRKHEEIDKLKKRNVEEIDITEKKDEEIDISKKKKHEEVDKLNKKKDDEIDISKKKDDETNALKRPAKIDVSTKPEISDSLWKPEAETEILMKLKEREMSKEDGEDNTFTENDAPKKPQEETDATKKPIEIDVLNKSEEIDVLKKPEENVVSGKADVTDALKKLVIVVLEYFCKEMFAKKMKKHVAAHISEMNSLQQEIAKALKLAIYPAKLVLDAIGKFFMQNSKSYGGKYRNEQIAGRQASVLILECFVMISHGIEITKEDKEYAEKAAIDWRNRMIKEGGLIKMEAVDARGLLLFISGFGIPDGVFSNEDFRDLIRASDVKKISNALRHSTILIPKLPEVIYWMVKNNFEIEAADIAYTFGLEDMCHSETMLMTFLKNIIKDTQNRSSLQVNAATMQQQLSDLKSIQCCLKTHKIDSSKFLPGVKINDIIEQLEKAINELDLKSTEERSTLKRKEKEIDVLNKPGEIDVLNIADEINASKKPVIAVLVDKEAEKSASFRKAGETDLYREMCINTHKETCISKRKHEEIDKAKKKDEEIDKSKKKNHEKINITKKKDEEIDITKKKKHEEVDTLNKKKDEEIDVSKKKDDETNALKRSAKIDVSKKPEISDSLWKPEAETEISMKLKERETSKEDEKDNTFTENDAPKKPQEETDASKKPIEIDILNKPKEIYVQKEPQEETDPTKKPIEIDVLNKPEEIDALKKPDEVEVPNKPEESVVSNKADEINASKKPVIAVLEYFCKEMFAKKMRKHIKVHIFEMNSLQQEIAKALKIAINPAKLVLDAIGKFFMQSRRAYSGKACNGLNAARQASVLILECFVMISHGIEIPKEDKEYAEKAAIDWRNRMIKEGGLIKTEADDARGLLLFISGFGIPDGVFSNQDFRDLIRASNVKKISNVLRHSTILIPKLPEVIYWMVKNNFEIEAADIAYTFGLEDMCHSGTMLMTFLKNIIKDTQNRSSLQVNAATMQQQLSDLKSIQSCLETHKIDSSKFLPGVKINEIIEQLEKAINELDLKSTEERSILKRKEKEIDVLNKPGEVDVLNKADEINASKKPVIAVLEYLCKEMFAKKMRKHIVAHISEMNSLHQDIAKALKLAINPAKLVLESIGSFFLTSSKTYSGKSSLPVSAARWAREARQASVLILECFVMISDSIEITKEDKEYAENAAINWRKRMIQEGGLIKMEAVDARGLLLFISGFGIPDGVFSNEDFRDLIGASDVKKSLSALCHSTILIPKLPEVIDWMVKNNLESEAADIAYTFGLEDKSLSETILMTFPHNKIKDTQNGSSLQVNAATMHQLLDPKSIRRCLETHKIDHSKFLPGIKINETIEEPEKVTKKPIEIDVLNKHEAIDVLKKPDEIDVLNKADEINASKKPVIAALEVLCKEMSTKKIKKHVVAHISELNSLHQEIAKALKLAINPAKLVLSSIGRYFLQTSGAYCHGVEGQAQIARRQASVLLLECFVMISGDGIEITKKDKEYAENAAIDWRKRMIQEGGLMYREALDARGLLLFISGFGIPDGVFSNKDFSDLIRASKLKDISNALRHSTILILKLPEVIDWMVNNNLEIEAADIAYTFGLEDKCHPETILMKLLHNIIKDTRNGSSLQVNAAIMKQLSDLKSIQSCLETNKIDPSKFLPGFNINEKIKQLEGKSALTRKENETESSKDPNNHQEKRICFSRKILPPEQNPHAHYNQSTQPSFSYLNENLPNNYVTTYSASPVFNTPLPPPNTLSSVHGGLAGSYDPSVYGRPFAEPMAYTNNPWPYGWHQGQPYSEQSQAYDPYHPSTADFYGRQPWPAESFQRLPDHSPPGGFYGSRVPSSDLYRFADTVVERESHLGPWAGSSITHPSHLY